MSFARFLSLALAGLLVLVGCGGAAEQRATPTPAPVSADIPELGRLINLPVRPVQVQWQANKKGGGDRMAIGPTNIEIVCR